MENVTSIDKIEKKYDKSGFFVKYGGSIAGATLLIGGWSLLLTFLCIKVYSKPIKANWAKYKCNPLIIPFAGIIQEKGPAEAPIYASQNFTECTNNILEKIVIGATKPVYKIVDNIVLIFKLIADNVQKMRITIFKLFKQLLGLSSWLQNKIISVIIPFQKLLLKLKDTLQKVGATISSSLLAVLGINLAFTSWLKTLITLFIIIFTLSAMYIINMWLIPFTWIPAAIYTVIWITFFTYFAIVAGWVGHIFKLTNASMPSSPGKPSCFDENTIIHTTDGYKKIKDIVCGDNLGKTNCVTAVFKAKNEQNMYNLNNVIVSGTHHVYHDKLNWIQVSSHPNAIYLPNYNKPILYCINTIDKCIIINNTVFTDWDDFNTIDFMKIKNYGLVNNIKNIHAVTDSGLIPTTLIKLKNKKTKKIQNINIGDILQNNETVLVIIKIKADDLINQKTYSFKNTLIHGSNLFFTYSHLGEFTSNTTNHNEQFLYHFITNTGKFTINNNIEIHDYNSTIEHILDIRYPSNIRN